MPSTATVTGKTGPAQTVTSLVLNNVTRLDIETFPKSLVKIYHDKGMSEFDIQATTTFTVTPSGGNLTVTISQ